MDDHKHKNHGCVIEYKENNHEWSWELVRVGTSNTLLGQFNGHGNKIFLTLQWSFLWSLNVLLRLSSWIIIDNQWSCLWSLMIGTKDDH